MKLDSCASPLGLTFRSAAERTLDSGLDVSENSLLLGFKIHLRIADILRTVAGFLGSLSPFVSLWRVAVLFVSLRLPSSPFVSLRLHGFLDAPLTVWALRWCNFESGFKQNAYCRDNRPGCLQRPLDSRETRAKTLNPKS